MRVLGCWIGDLAAGLADYLNADYVDVVAFSTATLLLYAVWFCFVFIFCLFYVFRQNVLHTYALRAACPLFLRVPVGLFTV
ncbi:MULTISPECIES: hypothetical protein [Plesiomonas]|uniref:hypothetical protein n=1 Tax=Plesiomonas TaxID=702 RepID=UPI001261C7F1|nr:MULTISPECIES: hypothetical protein [Plesiomonas]KAB7674188.1 hypothetical protein GBN23_14565 [Plesiomonas shigelloides]KAB7687778.1 hypothetical protein GBN28_10085 [Plesiomonas shigelloides]MCE5163204.1 hypothetical protein [Plesiomonas sp. PI-19]MCX9457803.1 hypothetical protein [Vibrio cholerae]